MLFGGVQSVYAQTGGTPPPNSTAPNISALECLFGSTAKCILVYASWLLFIKIPMVLMELAGIISNALFAYGLSSNAYDQPLFVNPGWVICRDIANTFFIFALLYIAIMTILGKLSGQVKGLLVSLIIVALFMNFSMYITRFVVDVGNVIALEFYNQFQPPDWGAFYVDFPGIFERDMNAPFMASIGRTNGVMTVADKLINSPDWPWAIFLYFCIGALVILWIFVLMAASFLMIGRVAMIWILMIVSPLAFFAYASMFFKEKFGTWSHMLIQQTFFPAIFLFFVYIAAMLCEATINNLATGLSDPNGQGGLAMIVTISIQFGLVAAFLIYGLKTATSMSGAAGAAASKYLTMGVGAGLGAAAYGARNLAGRTAGLAKLGLGEERMANLKTSVVGRVGLGALNKMETSSFDVRNTSLATAAGAAGLNFGKGTAKSYAQKQAEGDKEKSEIFKGLKTDEQRIKYLHSIEGPNVFGKGPAHFADADASARRLISSLPVADQQRLIEKAEGSDKRFLQRINASVAKDYGATGMAELYKSKEGAPKEQAALVSQFMETKRPDEVHDMMKTLTPANRAEIEKHIRTEDRDALKEINKKVFEKLKPKQQEAAKREVQNFEAEEKFTEDRNALEEKLAAYKTEVDTAKREKIEEEVDGIFNSLQSNKVTELGGDTLTDELITKKLKYGDVDKIKRANKLTRAQEDELYKNLSQPVKDQLKISPAETWKTRAPKNK